MSPPARSPTASRPASAASSLAVKVRADLNALLYADGIHDSLYRSAGRNLLTSTAALHGAAAAPVPLPRDDHAQALASA
jgi:hypothetical protein